MSEGPENEKIEPVVSGRLDIAGKSISYSVGAAKAPGTIRIVLELDEIDGAWIADAIRRVFPSRTVTP